jgi:hypothetical protein
MANKPAPASTLKHGRRRLLNHLTRLSPLDLFSELDDPTLEAIGKPKTDTAKTTRELDERERRAV